MKTTDLYIGLDHGRGDHHTECEVQLNADGSTTVLNIRHYSDPRCSDFDEDCADVPCKISCWLGGRKSHHGVVYETPPADGYCPYLRPE